MKWGFIVREKMEDQKGEDKRRRTKDKRRKAKELGRWAEEEGGRGVRLTSDENKKDGGARYRKGEGKQES